MWLNNFAKDTRYGGAIQDIGVPVNTKIDEFFSASGDKLSENIYQLIELIGLIIEDKNTLFLKPISDLIEGVIRKISLDENLRDDDNLKMLINKNIVNKSYINEI